LNHADRRLVEYAAYRRRLIDYAVTVVGDRGRAEDLVQEAYLRVAGLPADKPVDDAFAFMRRIVRNLAIDWLRKSSAERRVVAPDVEYDFVADDQASPERSLIDRQNVAIVMQALDELPPRTRAALEMRRFEGLPLAEIARRLGISITLAHRLVHRALQHCQSRLDGGK
jgi:RNA polymerase sigma-70 factor (ECF subfamily)